MSIVKSLLLCTSLIATAQATHILSNNHPLADGEPDDIKVLILKSAIQTEILENNKLTLHTVCKNWRNVIINHIFADKDLMKLFGSVEITQESYKDPEIAQKLQGRWWVTHLTIHSVVFSLDELYPSYQQVIVEGLRHKPKLKTLTFVGEFSLPTFFNLGLTRISGYGLFDFGQHSNNQEHQAIQQRLRTEEGTNTLAKDFLNLDHLKFCNHLEEFTAAEGLTSSELHNSFFKESFMHFKMLPNLKKRQIGKEVLYKALSNTSSSSAVQSSNEIQKDPEAQS